MGFILSVILTLIPFGLVMYPAFPSSVLLVAIIGLALLQILVQPGLFPAYEYQIEVGAGTCWPWSYRTDHCHSGGRLDVDHVPSEQQHDETIRRSPC
jgi:hypothetical protein